MKYPLNVVLDTNGTFLVSFTDIPEANSVGDTPYEAILFARDALESALEIYFDERRAVPLPSKISDIAHLNVCLGEEASQRILDHNKEVSND